MLLHLCSFLSTTQRPRPTYLGLDSHPQDTIPIPSPFLLYLNQKEEEGVGAGKVINRDSRKVCDEKLPTS